MDALEIVSHPRRREILRLVWTDERSAGDIAERFDVSFGAVSQQLRVLRDAGFVHVRAQGNQRFYRADRERLGSLATVLEAMWAASLDRLADAIEREVEAGAADGHAESAAGGAGAADAPAGHTSGVGSGAVNPPASPDGAP